MLLYCQLLQFIITDHGKLLSKQQVGKAVKPIQDVASIWWSTFSMVERKIGLKK
jgi:hypothetical protein